MAAEYFQVFADPDEIPAAVEVARAKAEVVAGVPTVASNLRQTAFPTPMGTVIEVWAEFVPA
jgi:hypothetical protein